MIIRTDTASALDWNVGKLRSRLAVKIDSGHWSLHLMVANCPLPCRPLPAFRFTNRLFFLSLKTCDSRMYSWMHSLVEFKCVVIPAHFAIRLKERRLEGKHGPLCKNRPKLCIQFSDFYLHCKQPKPILNMVSLVNFH